MTKPSSATAVHAATTKKNNHKKQKTSAAAIYGHFPSLSQGSSSLCAATAASTHPLCSTPLPPLGPFGHCHTRAQQLATHTLLVYIIEQEK